jgi:DinB superfamily
VTPALGCAEDQQRRGRNERGDRHERIDCGHGPALSDVEQAIRQAAAESAARLSRLSDADFDVEATSRNPRWGLEPAGFIVDHLLIAHVEKHIGQIRRNVTEYHQHKGNP